MRFGRWIFAPRVVPTLAAAAFVALTGSLSRWQGHRAEEKEARQAVYEAHLTRPVVTLEGPIADPQSILFRRVRMAGHWIAARQAFVDNRIVEGHAGFDVVTPLALASGAGIVLVNRGWLPRTDAYPKPPAVQVPGGTVQVQGIAALPPARFVELSPQAITGNVFQNLSIERFRKWSGLDVLPIEVFADPAGPGLVAIHERPDAGADQNRQYQATWFLLAATAIALWIGLNTRRAS